ncbi:serine--tRNA ligase [Gloeobacter violaceus]|uniref:Serine--tRNA ligase n=1 Tax=Gloeobacter violaceus (strain ATCC 29082 / PCC 7421) TaxID=251221 RepID=SYS_GLOVI|nr:serine--tRNA ligase [Gloeobacter violaceus]Q7NMP9.1 RecName: Full=Serine--tRNA ligase; AltName: Full=Seryl-tRNA synthetase; Short=SerRS; AltName: Full=Seryl-tRNA(Ser/Sec) synthetase [Gloeobacter violaceus PCC 7421]BAC88657.1 seryl-tRNA synthetase [Gloeobacter violaceus PCC 7421]
MLDPKLLRDDPAKLIERLNTRGGDFTEVIEQLVALDSQRRASQTAFNRAQAEGNQIGKQVGERLRRGTAVGDPEVLALKQRGIDLKATLALLQDQERELAERFAALLPTLPNVPRPEVPIGKDENDNREMRFWGTPPIFDFEPAAHWDLGERLGLMNFARATLVAQARFVTLMGDGALLERALIAFMLDRHRAHGYIEILPPYLVNTASMTGTGQLPKFAEDSFRCRDDDLWLIPTAEVPVTNLYRDEILTDMQLPIHHCAFTPCFRREAGSYGRDTRGLIRLHQFHKVELVKFCRPEHSPTEHEKLVADAEDVLQQLELPYRVIELCTGDLGFGAARCFDLEVWLPSQNRYREISSCSNFEDFQARRANLRFKAPDKKGTEFVHTLNGSGLAVGRTFAAILENYQNRDGTVRVPEALKPYVRRDVLSR